MSKIVLEPNFQRIPYDTIPAGLRDFMESESHCTVLDVLHLGKGFYFVHFNLPLEMVNELGLLETGITCGGTFVYQVMGIWTEWTPPDKEYKAVLKHLCTEQVHNDTHEISQRLLTTVFNSEESED